MALKGLMAESGETTPRCGQPEVSESVTAYCFGEISEQDRDRFEAHLLECDFCWEEVQRLDTVVRKLRSDKTLTQRQFASDIVGMAGISSEIHSFVAGHWIHAGTSAVIYAFIIAISVFMEIAYQYDVYATVAWSAAPLVFIWLAATTIGALAADWRLTRSGRASGLAASIGVLVFAAALQYAVLRPYLPEFSVTQASFQTWTAQAAYLKGVVYTVAFAAVFVLVPFHFIVTMQRELQSGRHRPAFDLLTGSRFGVAPADALYIRVWLLGALLLLGAVYTILSTAHLLEALKATEYSNLFIHTIQIRWLLFLALGLEGLAWYHSALNELKRECAAVYRLSNPHGPSR